MKTNLFFGLAAALAIVGCGGNVTVESTSGGGGGAGGGASTSSTGTTSSSTGTTTSTADQFTACDGPGQCVLAVPGCCEPCGYPQVDSYVAVNGAKVDAYHELVCPDPTPCPLCEGVPNPNLFAYCDAGKCVAADVRTHAVSACASEGDCHLRVGSACCEGCDAASASQVIAVSSTGPQLPSLVCSPVEGCDDCAPQYPADAFTYCGADGHCGIGILDN